MKKDQLLSISPLDGRYANECTELSTIFSEYNLIKTRLYVEISWFIHLSKERQIKELPSLTSKDKSFLANMVRDFTTSEAIKIKKIESVTKHDVKAVEYYIKDKIKKNKSLKKYLEFVHIFCTSEDINNLSYALMIKNGLALLLKQLELITNDLNKKSIQYSRVAMISHTHGQAATPTTMGKEMRIFYKRLDVLIKKLAKIKIMGKFNGASGNYSSHLVAYPNVNWPKITQKFISDLGLKQNTHTTQIESHDYISEICNLLSHTNSVLLGFSQDMWSYISKSYFSQKNVKGEIGSSTMPHKINPINYENAEGNLGLSNSLLTFFSSKLVISRLQRDLSDSTVLRNIGVAFGYAIISYKNILIGQKKIILNKNKIKSDLDECWEVLSEPIQMIARKFTQKDPYELLKKHTRGKKLDKKSVEAIISELDIPVKEKNKLLKLKPCDYIGMSEVLSKS